MNADIKIKKNFKFMRLMLFLIFFSFFTGMLSFSAFAVSVDDMIALKNNGVDENLIISGFIEQKVKQVLTIDDLVKLKNAGFSGNAINRIGAHQGNDSQQGNSVSKETVIIKTPGYESVSTSENVYLNKNIIVMGSRFSNRKYGCLEIKNNNKWPLLVDIDYQNRRIWIKKLKNGFYSGTSTFIKSYSSTIFRVPSGSYLVDVPEEGSTYYIDVTTAGAELILNSRRHKKNDFLSLMIRVLGKKLFVPVRKHDRQKHYKGKHYKGKDYKKHYGYWKNGKYHYYHKRH